RFLFHRTWILSSKLTLQSKADLAQHYVRQGGSAEWFEANQEKLSRNDNSFYKMTKQEELESGLIDRQMASWAQFVLEY
ncbi:MAG: hypothetical protein H7333_08175, partial [Bdellovibrionales bacterium]|nr:hypothetical protein [Oligoflexia bacterium]